MDNTTITRLNALAKSIARLEKKVDFILAELKLNYVEETDYPPALAEVVALIKDGKIASAVKAYMQASAVSMTEAKEAVDTMDMEIKSRGNS